MQFPSDFIALGSKAGSAGGGAKRDGAGAASGSSGSQSGATAGFKKAGGASGSSVASGKAAKVAPPEWETMAIDIDDISNFTQAVMAAEEDDEFDRVNGLLCGAVKLLRGQRAKPDQLLYLALMFLAKSNSYVFSGNDAVLQAFCSLLKRDVKESYKSKGNALVSVLAANVLMAAFQKEKSWPEIFVRVFIDDSMGERLWVDHPDCRGFVDNIITAFGTKIPTATQSLFPKPPGRGNK